MFVWPQSPVLIAPFLNTQQPSLFLLLLLLTVSSLKQSSLFIAVALKDGARKQPAVNVHTNMVT